MVEGMRTGAFIGCARVDIQERRRPRFKAQSRVGRGCYVASCFKEFERLLQVYSHVPTLPQAVAPISVLSDLRLMSSAATCEG